MKQSMMLSPSRFLYRKLNILNQTHSVCPVCKTQIEAEVFEDNGQVFLKRACSEHGEFYDFLEEDAGYYRERYSFDKPGTDSNRQTVQAKGCPFDCGLCPSHRQHTCIGVIEVTQRCNTHCPMCYAHADREKGDLDIQTIGRMLDFYQEAEGGQVEVVQISGGEPTLHPDILKIIQMARQKAKYVMLNTNGRRIAEDEEFVKGLSQFRGRFEVYLQFDGFSDAIYSSLRSPEFKSIKLKAVEQLAKYQIPITLVPTIQKGINDEDLGRIIEFGMQTPYVRGINFQPVARFGLYDRNLSGNAMSLTGILKRIEKQTRGETRMSDFIPLPCNVERVAVIYFYKEDGKFIPVTRNARVRDYLPMVKNTFAFNLEDIMAEAEHAFSNGQLCQCMAFLKDFMPIVPPDLMSKSREERIRYVDENTFRMSVTSFVDLYNCDLNALKKECVHMITPDLKRIPFSSYNMFYRTRSS